MRKTSKFFTKNKKLQVLGMEEEMINTVGYFTRGEGSGLSGMKMHPPIVGFAGKAGSGKDTAADYLVHHFSYKKFTFAGPIKEACRELYGFTHEELYGSEKNKPNELGFVPREKFTKLGDMCREEDPLFFIKRLKQQIHPLLSQKKNIVISDVRFKDEIDFIKENNGIIIGIYRNVNLPASLASHSSENLDLGYTDYVIENNKAFSELYSKIESILFSI